MDAAAERGWFGPAGAGAKQPFSWRAVVWAIVYPQRGQRTMPTVPGLMLIGLALGIGTAAYNSSSNILFITLALLLACLVLSGVLSWINFRRVAWRLRSPAPWRVGQEGTVLIDAAKPRARLPSYGLWFELSARAVEPEERQRAEATLSVGGREVREILARAERSLRRARLPLRGRLAPGEAAKIEWAFKPERRGCLRVELVAVGSLFPFGFLRKEIAGGTRFEAIVWPARIDYRRLGLAPGRRGPGAARAVRPGTGSDLIALRRYEAGDSHRLIHWKASARTGRLLVRQFAAEVSEGCLLAVDTDAARWPRAAQFETLVSFAVTLAEDLFRAGRLAGVALDGETPRPVRSVHDLEGFMDRLAVVAPREIDSRRPVAVVGRRHVITFAPEGQAGVGAWLDGMRWASA